MSVFGFLFRINPFYLSKEKLWGQGGQSPVCTFSISPSFLLFSASVCFCSNLTVYSRGARPSFSTAIWLVRFKVSLTCLKSSMPPYCTSTTSPCREEEQTHKLSSLQTEDWSLPNHRLALLSNFFLSRLTQKSSYWYDLDGHLIEWNRIVFDDLFLFLYSEASLVFNFNFFWKLFGLQDVQFKDWLETGPGLG